MLEQLTGELLAPSDIAGWLPDPPANRQPERRLVPARQRDDDPLLRLAPAVYVEALTGLPPGRDGKVSCPFHEDAIPSLHAYPTAAQGWYCFGCGRGGSVYDLAAELWGRDTHGRDFLTLRDDPLEVTR